MIFGKKRKEQGNQTAEDGPPSPSPRSLFRTGRSQFEPAETSEPVELSGPPEPFEPAETSGPSERDSGEQSGVTERDAGAADGSVGRPRVVFSAARSGPDEFTDSLPIMGALAGVIAGPDRPDYCLVVLDEPIDFEPPADFDRDRIRQSAIDQMTVDLDDLLPITTLVVAARQTGTQISPTMIDLVVNIAYVLDESVLTDATLIFDKVHFAAVATLNLE